MVVMRACGADQQLSWICSLVSVTVYVVLIALNFVLNFEHFVQLVNLLPGCPGAINHC